MNDMMTVTRTFAAPRERVYEAWTRPEYFAVWFGGEEVDVPRETVSMDARVGGRWSAVMQLPDGHEIHWAGEYTEVDPPARLAFTMTDDPAHPDDEPVTVVLEESAEGTRMTLTQPVADFTAEQVELTVAGYNRFFDAMEALVTANA